MHEDRRTQFLKQSPHANDGADAKQIVDIQAKRHRTRLVVDG
jgi:hypothetical protein